jgi:FixJ family two-component response regulator
MFNSLNTLHVSSLSGGIAALCPDDYGINQLDETTFDSPVRVERGSETPLREIICVVDDDPLVLKSVGRLLESAGFDAITFGEPKSFLEYLAKNSVPLAILDIWMEEMTGMELLAHLCAKSPKTRVIFMSAHQDSAAKATVMQAGALAFFIKPFQHDYFLDAVRCALGYSLQSMKEAVA